jgi:hypothetical protein
MLRLVLIGASYLYYRYGGTYCPRRQRRNSYAGALSASLPLFLTLTITP